MVYLHVCILNKTIYLGKCFTSVFQGKTWISYNRIFPNSVEERETRTWSSFTTTCVRRVLIWWHATPLHPAHLFPKGNSPCTSVLPKLPELMIVNHKMGECRVVIYIYIIDISLTIIIFYAQSGLPELISATLIIPWFTFQRECGWNASVRRSVSDLANRKQADHDHNFWLLPTATETRLVWQMFATL